MVPLANGEELVRNSGLPDGTFTEVGTHHRLADAEKLAKMLGVRGAKTAPRTLSMRHDSTRIQAKIQRWGCSKVQGVLVIVPCGQKKVWDRSPNLGPTVARDAYTGPPFGINRAFAERFGEAWVILSAKYGFIEPAFMISAPYDITFKKRRTGPISTDQLREQIRKDNLSRFTTVIGLGGKEYREAIELAFADVPLRLCFPFSGLPIGKAMQATKRAIATDDPMWERKAIQ